MPDPTPRGTAVPIKPSVSMADVERLDVRVGTIVTVEDVPKSSKLVRLRVDFGMAPP